MVLSSGGALPGLRFGRLAAHDGESIAISAGCVGRLAGAMPEGPFGAGSKRWLSAMLEKPKSPEWIAVRIAIS
jgi:hypothetical protein